MFTSPLPTPQKQPFSNAKRSILSKNASATDLTQYINPILIRRRSSLHTNALDPTMKKIRQREAYKTAMCQAWLEGRNCAFGEQCNFAHGEEELQPLPANRPNPKYKTRICENYTTTGICPFGNRCFFIHPKTEEELQKLIKQNEQKIVHHLEGEAIIQTPIRPQMGIVRRVGGKLKQFRKMETCGAFNIQQIPNDSRQEKPMSRKRDENFYENYPPLATTVEMLTGKGLINLKSNVINSIPLTHSTSASNLLFYKPKKNMGNNETSQAVEDLRLTMRKMQQQKSFSSSDVCSRASRSTLFEKEEAEDENSSSGPHTPPGFYEQQRGCSTVNSTTSLWPLGLKSEVATTENQAMSSSFLESYWYEPDQFGGRGTGIGEGPMEKGLRANHNFGGKKSPIKDFEGILVGRRSSHIPLSEDDRAQLKALEEEIQMGKNKSMEFLYGSRKGMMTTKIERKGKMMVNFAENWQLGTQSMGALNEANRSQTQFGHWEMAIADQQEEEEEEEEDLGEEEEEEEVEDEEEEYSGGRIAHQNHHLQFTERTKAQAPKAEYQISKTMSGEFRASGFPPNPVGTQSPFSSSCPIQKHQRSVKDPKLDKMRHIWALSSSELDKPKDTNCSPTVLSWTPFGKVEVPSEVDSSADLSDNEKVKSRKVKPLQIHKMDEENGGELELANLVYDCLQMQYVSQSTTSSADNKKQSIAKAFGSVGEGKPPPSPTWAQLVRKKEFLRQKSHSSPAMAKNNLPKKPSAEDEA